MWFKTDEFHFVNLSNVCAVFHMQGHTKEENPYLHLRLTDGTDVTAIDEYKDAILAHLEGKERKGHKKAREENRWNRLAQLYASDRIGRLNLSTRTHNALKRADIETIGKIFEQFLDPRMSGLAGIRGFGERSFNELMQALRHLDIDGKDMDRIAYIHQHHFQEK